MREWWATYLPSRGGGNRPTPKSRLRGIAALSTRCGITVESASGRAGVESKWRDAQSARCRWHSAAPPPIEVSTRSATQASNAGEGRWMAAVLACGEDRGAGATPERRRALGGCSRPLPGPIHVASSQPGTAAAASYRRLPSSLGRSLNTSQIPRRRAGSPVTTVHSHDCRPAWHGPRSYLHPLCAIRQAEARWLSWLGRCRGLSDQTHPQ